MAGMRGDGAVDYNQGLLDQFRPIAFFSHPIAQAPPHLDDLLAQDYRSAPGMTHFPLPQPDFIRLLRYCSLFSTIGTFISAVTMRPLRHPLRTRNLLLRLALPGRFCYEFPTVIAKLEVCNPHTSYANLTRDLITAFLLGTSIPRSLPEDSASRDRFVVSLGDLPSCLKRPCLSTKCAHTSTGGSISVGSVVLGKGFFPWRETRESRGCGQPQEDDHAPAESVASAAEPPPLRAARQGRREHLEALAAAASVTDTDDSGLPCGPPTIRVVYDDEEQPLYYSCTVCGYDYTSAIHCRCCDGSEDCGCIPDVSRKRARDPGQESHHHPHTRARNLDGVRRCHRLDRGVIVVSAGDDNVHSSDLHAGPAADRSYVKFIKNAQSESKGYIRVNWWQFKGTNLEAGWRVACDLASSKYTHRWYVGLAESPVRQMEGDRSHPAMNPHPVDRRTECC